MDMKKYYEAYDDRYGQVHGQNLRWFSDTPSPIVGTTMAAFGISTASRILELGCGEGRDAKYLLSQGFELLATDISPRAIEFCRRDYPDGAAHFQVLDCVNGKLDESFDFIYAVAVVHMLVENGDRDGFYRFIRDHLKDDGTALVCTMGGGTEEFQSDISTAFDLHERTHQHSGRNLMLAGTSCRVVNFDTFRQEIHRNGLAVIRDGLTSAEPDFPTMMYAVIRRG